MAVDHIAVIEREAARTLAAYQANPGGKVPWSDRWSVNSVARHVARSHHVVSQIIEDRPNADFGLFDSLVEPPKGDPGFPAWFAAGTEALVAQCRATPAAEKAWTPHPAVGDTVGYWTPHMAHETLVHRWDAELGAGITGPAMDPEVAAGAVDEYLGLLLGAIRAVKRSPAGPSVRIACTDAGGDGDGDWYVDLGEAGRHPVHREPIDVALTLRGPAEGLLLFLYGRVDAESAGLHVDGDHAVLARWSELAPSG